MLDGEVRFGNDWADQVTQFSSWGNYCHGNHARARACVWTCVCVAFCACLSVRASLRLNVCTSFDINIHFFLYIRRHTCIHCINKGLRHLNECAPMFYFFFYIFHNKYIFPFCVSIDTNKI